MSKVYTIRLQRYRDNKIWVHGKDSINSINSIRSNNISFKQYRFTPSGCKDKANRKFGVVAKTQRYGKTFYFLISFKIS